MVGDSLITDWLELTISALGSFYRNVLSYGQILNLLILITSKIDLFTSQINLFTGQTKMIIL